jgi:hypothetical protein
LGGCKQPDRGTASCLFIRSPRAKARCGVRASPDRHSGGSSLFSACIPPSPTPCATRHVHSTTPMGRVLPAFPGTQRVPLLFYRSVKGHRSAPAVLPPAASKVRLRALCSNGHAGVWIVLSAGRCGDIANMRCDGERRLGCANGFSFSSTFDICGALRRARGFLQRAPLACSNSLDTHAQ